MTRTIYLITVFLLSAVSGLHGQTSRSMTIDEMFRLAEEQNTDIGTAVQAIGVARQEEKIARSARLPQVDLSLTLSYLGNGTILDRDFSNPTRDKLPHFSNTLGVELYQPVYTGGAIAGAVSLSKSQTELADVGFDATKNSVRIAIVRNCLELAKNRNLLAVYDENIRLTEKLLGEMRARHEQGVVLKNDITRYELKLSSLGYDRLATENAIRICNANLVSLLGIDASTDIIPQPSAVYDDIREVDAWLQSAAVNAPQIRSYEVQTNMESIKRRIAKSEYIPKIGIVVGDSFLGPVTFEVPALNKNYNAWFVGVNLKWNISSLFTAHKSVRKHNMQIARIQSAQSAEQESLNRRIHEAYTLYRQSIERLEIERKNIQLAEENYAVVSNRFDNRLALLTDMLDASNALLDAGVRLVNAEISAQFYYYQLHFISGTLITL
ncbi:MAG: TolC family protein [Alistipes sp.]